MTGRPRRPEVLACVSASAARGVALLREPEVRHIWIPPHAGGPVPSDVRAHRSRPLVPARGGVESVPDMLAHVAVCLPRLEAFVVWESALDRHLLTGHEVSMIRWPRVARPFAREASRLSGSLIETLVLHRLRPLGLEVHQQVRLRGHAVDFLVNGRLVVQVDGFRFHTAAQRRRDIEHDALLGFDGHSVLRFAYGDVVERWDHVEGVILRTLARC